MGSPRIEDTFVKVIFGWGILAAMFTSGPVKVNVFVGANRQDITYAFSETKEISLFPTRKELTHES